MVKEKHNALVTIGFIASRDSENTVYALNTILGQSYPNIELIVSVDKTTGISMCDIIDCINSNRKDNVKYIDINYTKDYKGIGYHIKYIHEKSQGEYITFVQNTQGYYDANAISGMMENIREHSGYKVWKGQTVMFNAAGEYIGNALPQSAEDLSMFYSKVGLKKESVFHTQPNGDYKEEEIATVDVPFLRYVKEDVDDSLKEDFLTRLRQTDKKILSAAHFAKLNQMLSNLNKYIPAELYRELDAELKYLQFKEENTFWQLTDSDFTYGKMLLDIQKLVNAEKKRLSIMDYIVSAKMMKSKISKMRRKKIHLVFFAQEYSVWTSMQSVYEAAVQDDRFEVDLVYVTFEHFNSQQSNEMQVYRDKGYPVIHWSEYNLQAKSPDVAFFLKAYDYLPDGFYIRELNHVIDKSIYLGYGIILGVKNAEFIRLNHLLPLYTLAWKNVCYGLEEYQGFLQHSYVHGKNCWNFGSARFDAIHQNRENSEYVKRIRHLAAGRRIILWNTHHTIGEDGALGTFLEYSYQMLNYAKEHKEIFFVWRPHPLFFSALQNCIAPEDYEKLWAVVDTIENICLDTERDYLGGFYVSDAMVSDYSSLIKEYILLKKPMLVTQRSDRENVVDPRTSKAIKHTTSFDGIDRFLAESVKGIDPQIEEYIQKEYYFPPDGSSVAQQILDGIWEETACD